MKTADFFTNILKNAGHRITEQRRVICRYLAETEEHPTPYQAFAEISAGHPEISRATVYNTLNLLKELGAIVEIGFGDDHTHYETDVQPHINLICMRCHQISDYPAPALLLEIETVLPNQAHFQPWISKMDVYGLCADCQTQLPQNTAPI
ncbi:MAG: Fur family transcriptional regulator [Caldilineaceae bacterium]